MDNEPGLVLIHNDHVFDEFVRRLREQFGDVATLNREWGLTYWSHRLTDWSELWRPDGNSSPQYDLAWRRFQAELTTEFISWQADLVRDYNRPDQFVTTCLQYGRPAVDDERLTSALDITAGNPYYGMQDRLDATREQAPLTPWTTTGVAALFRQADRMYASKQARYLVTETNAQSISGSDSNFPPYPGQLKQAAYTFISRGAAMIEYWHWHTLPYGYETYWGGVLPHSLVPGRVYREVAEIGGELAQIGTTLDGFEPNADVAILWSNPSRYALHFTPPFRADGQSDPESFETLVDAFHRGCVDAGRQVRLLHLSQAAALGAAALAERFPVLVAAGIYITTDAELQLLRDYVTAGGHLLIGPRTGYADEEARARVEVSPALLADLAGAHYEEYSNLDAAVPVIAASADLPLATEAAAGLWIDGLIADGADVLARYDHPRFGDFPAVTSHAVDGGRVTVIGCVPNPALASGIIRWAAPSSHAAALVSPADDVSANAASPVTVTSGSLPDGRRAWFVFNWGWEPQTLTLATPVTDTVTGAALRADTAVPLGAWSTRTFITQ